MWADEDPIWRWWLHTLNDLAHVTRERDLIARWLSADETAVTRGRLEYTAKYGFNFRSALEADKLAVDNGDPLPALDTEALAEDASSPGGLYYYYSRMQIFADSDPHCRIK